MSRAHWSRASLAILAIVTLLVTMNTAAYAKERQLAGVRLNDHAIDLLDIYGPPDGVVTGPPGPAFPPEVEEAGLGMGMGIGGPGMAAGMGADMGPMGPGGMMRPPPRMTPGGGMMGTEMGPGGMPMALQPSAGAGAFPGAPAAGQALPGTPGAPMAGAEGGLVPNWALPVYIDTEPSEMMWIYQRGPVTLGFLLDVDGYVQDICVAADKCSYARTAMWQPHKYIKLGDDYTCVLKRYGWPPETITYQASGLGVGAATPSVTFNSINKTFSRDCVLRYAEEGNNIDFVMHDFKIVRIHIWD